MILSLLVYLRGCKRLRSSEVAQRNLCQGGPCSRSLFSHPYPAGRRGETFGLNQSPLIICNLRQNTLCCPQKVLQWFNFDLSPASTYHSPGNDDDEDLCSPRRYSLIRDHHSSGWIHRPYGLVGFDFIKRDAQISTSSITCIFIVLR